MIKFGPLIASALMTVGLAATAMAADMPKSTAPMMKADDAPASAAATPAKPAKKAKKTKKSTPAPASPAPKTSN